MWNTGILERVVDMRGTSVQVVNLIIDSDCPLLSLANCSTCLLLHPPVDISRINSEEHPQLYFLYSLSTLNPMSWSIHTSLQKHRTMIHQTLIPFAKVKIHNTQTEFKNPSTLLDKSSKKAYHLKEQTPVVSHRHRPRIHLLRVNCVANGDPQELYDEDEELCPVECVREIKKDEELLMVLDKAKKGNTLVVVDFYRTSCGSCKYIEQGFAKLCKGSGDEDAAVIFLKHNVIDEYDEQSDIAERLRIKAVPLFHFYKNGTLLEAFPTRDKERIKAAIEKYTAPTPAPAA